MITKGQKVKIFFNNGFKLEGTVEIWTPQQSILLHEGKTLIIYDTAKNVMVVQVEGKIVQPKMEEQSQPSQAAMAITSTPSPSPAVTNLSVKQAPSEKNSLALRAKKLAELRIKQVEEEKNKIKKQFNSELKGNNINYELPNFTQRSASFSSSKKGY